jgi:hypothetical protein
MILLNRGPNFSSGARETITHSPTSFRPERYLIRAKPHPNEYSWPTVPLTAAMSDRKLVVQGLLDTRHFRRVHIAGLK